MIPVAVGSLGASKMARGSDSSHHDHPEILSDLCKQPFT